MPRPCFRLTPLALAAALALPSLVFIVSPAHAQTSTAMPIYLPAQSLGAALNELARQAGLQLMVHPDLVADKQAPAVSGSLTPRQALDRVLAGSGLTADIQGAEVIIRRMPAAESGVTTLVEMKVTAQGMDDGTTEGTGSYTTRSMGTATGLVLSPRETPQSVSVITHQRIEDQRLVSVAEALRNAPGVSYKAIDRGRGGTTVRGFSLTNFQIDGVPTILDANMDIDNASIAIYDRIEVVHGATGLRSGAGDPGATINLVRKHANSKVFTGNLMLEAGSWNRYGATADLTAPLNTDGSVRARVVANYRDQDGFIDFEQTRTTVFYGIVDADLGNRTRLSLGFSDQRNERKGTYWGGLPVWYADGTRTEWDRSKTTAAKWHRWDDHLQSVFASLDHYFESGWSIQVNAQYLRAKEVTNLLWFGGLPDRTTGLGMSAWPYYYRGKPRQHQINVQAGGPFELFGRTHELMVGAVYMHGKSGWDSADQIGDPAPVGDFNHWDGSYPEPAYGPTYVGRGQTETQSAAYAAARLNLSDPLKLIVGTRVTRFDRDITAMWGAPPYEMRESAVFTPYLGVLYDLSTHLTAYAGYTSIFSPQNLRDRNGGYLNPLEGQSYEAGLKSEFFDGNLYASASVFRIQQENFGVLDGGTLVPGTTERAYRAEKGVKSEGYELEVTGRILPRWDVSLSWTQFSAKNREGERVAFRYPSRMLKLFTKYDLSGALNGLSIGGNVEWQNDMPDWRANPATGLQENVGQSAFATVGLMARYQLNKSLSVQANIYNLFDKQYYEGSWGTFTYGEPRRILANLTYRF